MTNIGIMMTIFLGVWAGAPGGALYRLRGGPVKDWSHVGTQVARLVFAVPTGLLMGLLYLDWQLGLATVVSVFLGLALLGHGAHMFISATFWRKHWVIGVDPVRTELLTRWLPKVFGGTPNENWPDAMIVLYDVVGMTVIGVVRTTLWFAPLAIFGHLNDALWLASTGLVHGIVYWAADGDSKDGEIGIGFVTWATIVVAGLTI